MTHTGFKSVYVTVLGRVQGVGYRSWCASKAERLGLHGWIRNRHDGCVEAVYHGLAGRVDEMVALSEKGPVLAKVTDILASPCDPPESAGFLRRSTY
ncbi:acylphosphatase [Roseibium algae]|uniref:acylphosphatase n=1 Tax=Roseibium algae TaxID=3123038 RepID=A0ABU8TR54_9HYPH